MSINGKFASPALTDALSEGLAEVARRVSRSLVVIQNGGGLGAGIIWRSDGFILTNHHVVARGRPRVLLENGAEWAASKIAEDPSIDLALLRIEMSNLPAALVADSRSLRVGQIVLAVGHPWGQRALVTAGIISGLDTARVAGPRGEVPVIRSDVELAPGNSGGPLVNAAGAVVGINTMIVGGDLGVAIPSQVASAFVEASLPQPAGFPFVSVQAERQV